MTEQRRDPGDAPDPNEEPRPTYPTPPAPPPYAPGDPAAYPPPGPVGYTPPGPGPEGYTPPPPAGPQGELGQTGPMGYQPPPVPPAKKTNWLGLGILLIIVAVIIVAFILFRDRLGGGVADLAVGDCFDEPAATTDIEDVQHQPCNTPHDGEVFFVLTDPATGAHPDSQHFRDLALQQCVPAATAYMGTDFNSRLDIDMGWFYPTADSWGGGDRGMSCYLYRVDDQKLTGSLRNIGTGPLQ